jgi:hypothetical protein
MTAGVAGYAGRMAEQQDQDPRVEEPEHKDLQDQTFGKEMQAREERAERGEPDPGEEPAKGAWGKA